MLIIPFINHHGFRRLVHCEGNWFVSPEPVNHSLSCLILMSYTVPSEGPPIGIGPCTDWIGVASFVRNEDRPHKFVSPNDRRSLRVRLRHAAGSHDPISFVIRSVPE